MKNIGNVYVNRKEHYKKLNDKQKKTLNFISMLRLMAVLVGIGFGIYFFIKKFYFIGSAIIAAAVIVFVFLVKWYSRVKDNFKCTSIICEINENCIKRLNGQWKNFKDTGEEFIDDKHSYSYDLDIFGKNSLFQWINAAVTYFGRVKLKEMLTVIPNNINILKDKQEAVDELALNISWRQRFMALGRVDVKEIDNPQNLIEWGNKFNDTFEKAWLIIIVNSVCVITGLLFVLTFILHKIPYNILLIWGVFIGVSLKVLNNKKGHELDSLHKWQKNITAYKNMLKMIENKRFKSSYLNKIKNNITCNENGKAYKAIEELEKISNSIYDRKNMGYIIQDVILLWDFRCLFRLEKWKKKHGGNFKKWLLALGEFEALSSLSIIRYDNTDWQFPTFEEDSLVLSGQNVGHPLLTEKRICNDINIDKEKSILLITGSNMSGKSTFLRTAGINLVLAYSGAPVCAQKFCCSLMNIYTCMRVNDDLEKRISSFYAEILRIKNLVNAVNNGEKVFFLLDEIFKGTNSMDRHTGAEILINKLSQEKACGMVSTHDFELCDLEKKNNKIKNYNFREFYEDNKINFDYKLREGVSKTRNALYLMKMAGIDV